MAVSEYFTDEELISQFKMYFDETEQNNINFESYLGQIEEVEENTCRVIIKGRTFEFDKIFCGVVEV